MVRDQLQITIKDRVQSKINHIVYVQVLDHVWWDIQRPVCDAGLDHTFDESVFQFWKDLKW